MTRWFRWYEGATEDGKFRLVTRKSRVTIRDVLAVWAVMLEDAANLAHDGVCTKRFDLIESVLDMEDGQVRSIIEPMAEIGLVNGTEGNLTICNWGKRQFKSDRDETASDRKRKQRSRERHDPVTRDTVVSHAALETDTESDTEKKEVEAAQAQPARKRGTRLPENFEPSPSGIEFAKERSLDPTETLAKFKDHWTAATGKGSSKLDWDAAWRTWCRNEVAFRPRTKTQFADKGAYSAPVTSQEARNAMRHMAYAAIIKAGRSPGVQFSTGDRTRMIAAGMVTMEECEAAGCSA